ncbi:endoribonuclease MazF [Nostoc sp. CHAB 5836]|uniref:endoribonuclease MazF n=1 Tax=Nostoc sp. CHAB 5836 TaxID=2780404 RepID=UPI001E40A87C|nr:endoribonuclease MazF [Nostoc sp. CHAB 5836]MCC5613715.1 endoribonuclease MazF [Nostoc sp. CHAB 5836]
MKYSDSELYIPKQGDIIWINFTPQIGREQAGRRPALVISPLKYNRQVRLALVCPITTKVKGYPFEVPVSDGLAVSGVVLADQVKSFDWQERKAEFACKAPDEVIVEVITLLRTLMPLP